MSEEANNQTESLAEVVASPEFKEAVKTLEALSKTATPPVNTEAANPPVETVPEAVDPHAGKHWVFENQTWMDNEEKS